MTHLAALIGVLIFSTGCATVRSRSAVLCPPVKIYSADFQSHVETELQQLPDSSTMLSAMRDYLQLRDELGECNGLGMRPPQQPPAPLVQLAVGTMTAITWHTGDGPDELRKNPVWLNPAVTLRRPGDRIGAVIGTGLGPRLRATGLVTGVSVGVWKPSIFVFGGVRWPLAEGESVRGVLGAGLQLWSSAPR